VLNTINQRRGKRIRAALWLLALALPAGLQAQDGATLTRISTSTQDAWFQVDQQWFNGSAVFTWPAGTKHTLSIAAIQYAAQMQTTRYLFSGWTSPVGPLTSGINQVTVTADPRIAWYNALVQTEYAITLSYFPCSDNSCIPPGTVWINALAYSGDSVVWRAAGQALTVEAVPSPGYVFIGWSQGGGTLAPVYSFVLNAPVSLYPRFTTARSIQLQTSPGMFQILADRAPVTAPATLQWGWNTTHTLGVISPQRDNHGLLWVFHSWSDGGAASHTYQVAPLNNTGVVEAQFVRAVPVAAFSEPSGLSVTVDGADVVTPRSLVWGLGETHTMAAPAHQTDAAGNPWAFRSWSNGGAAAQTFNLTPDQADSGIRLTAQYDPLSRIRVDSIPSGIALTVDGAECRTPCEIERSVGSMVQLAAPASVAGSDGVRYGFESWDGTRSTLLQTTAGFRKITALYSTWYRLTLSSRPGDGGSWQITPASGDGFFKAGSSVALGFTAAGGMRFQGWELDLTGSANPAALAMNAPHAVRAVAEPLPPAPAPLRVSNAAAESISVAPGSIASLFGADLALATVLSTADPLTQSLGGVALQCAGRLLPLLYVSAGQINFQVASDLEPGMYTLELHRDGGVVRTVDFTVARYAPGLFAVLHQDGSAITPDAPAHSGERVALYGTGFGPYVTPAPDGFRVPVDPPDPLTDSLQVLAAGRMLPPEFAGAGPALTGIALVLVVLPGGLEAGVAISVAVAVGGIESNAVLIPME
jgi:uncharacterized protein (TIGR03437 family)